VGVCSFWFFAVIAQAVELGVANGRIRAHVPVTAPMWKIRVGNLAGMPLLGVTVIATANPCKIERVGAIPSISTNFLRGEKRLSTLDASGDLAGVPFA
jgi:hypothetical protein